MAYLNFNFKSRYLEGATSVGIILPGYDGLRPPLRPVKEMYQRGKQLKTLYLLHGAYEDHSAWLRGSKIEQYAEEHNIAVIMPDAYTSYYTDMKVGKKYFSYLSEELPAVMEATFPLSQKREERFVAGMSMGGRGAFLWAMKCPSFFAGAASLSGSLDVNLLIERNKRMGDEWKLHNFKAIFGDFDKIKGSDNDVYTLAAKLLKKDCTMPKFLIGCGTEDVRYKEQHLPFIQYASELGFPLDTMKGPGGHDYTYWDSAIKQTIEWFEKIV